MNKIFHRKDGQVAPFMIAIIVVLIMAIMVTVNIGKVSLTKTRTANAADAGALAGSTMHANTLNAIADTNTQMIAEYLATEALFVVAALINLEYSRFLAYWAFVIAQITQFALAWNTGIQGYDDAEKAAKQLAFMNSGVDEAKARLSGESYQAYLSRDSQFGQWMASDGYESGVYNWADKNGGQNSFTVNVDAPAFPGLIPMPGVFISLYFRWIPVCTNCGYVPCCNCLSCNTAAAEFRYLVQQANRGLINLPSYTPVSVNAGSSSSIAVQPFCPCGGMLATSIVIYTVPIAWIAGIVSDNPELTVTTNRFEPNADLGLWEMKYGNISSSAKAKSSGGSIGIANNPRYDSYLIPGGS